jgi:branched-chain amino acid transport system ATP-binding protein
MSTKPHLLDAKDVNVAFGGLRALSHINLHVGHNEVVGLIGPNGAGKTTMFNTICGIVKPDMGELRINGGEPTWPKTNQLANLGIARTLQGVGLFPELTVMENVMIGAQRFSTTGLLSASFGINSRDEKNLEERAHVALERVYAAGLSHRLAGTLSYPDATLNARRTSRWTWCPRYRMAQSFD